MRRGLRGLPAVQTYSLGLAVVPGGVQMLDSGFPLDVIRFNMILATQRLSAPAPCQSG